MLVWSAICLPRIPHDWLRSSPEVNARLALAAALVPAGAPLLASNGVAGAFADRKNATDFAGAGRYPLVRGDDYVLLVPFNGIEFPAEGTLRAIGCLARDPRATTLMASNSVWLFRVRAAADSWLDLGACPPPEAAAFPTDVGSRRFDARGGRLEVASSFDNGYLLRSAYFRRPSGRYRLDIEMAADAPARVEISDFVAHKTLAVRQIEPARSPRRVSIGFDFTASSERSTLFEGFGPFHVPQLLTDDDGVVEIAVWIPAKTAATIDWLELRS